MSHTSPPPPTSHVATVATVTGAVVAIAALVIAYFAWKQPVPPTEPPPPGGRAAYIAQADALCTDAISEFDRYGPMPQQNNAALTRWMDDTVKVFDNLYARWAKLTFPREDDKLVRAILDPFKSTIAHLHASQKSMHRAVTVTDDLEFNRIVQSGGEEYNDAMKQALVMDNAIDAYGMRACSSLFRF